MIALDQTAGETFHDTADLSLADTIALALLFSTGNPLSGGLDGHQFLILSGLANLIGADGWDFQPGTSHAPTEHAATGIDWVHAHPSGISIRFFRLAGANDFTPRESRLARILLEEVPWLLCGTVMPPKQANRVRLPPRHLQAYELLKLGMDRKTIAARMGVAPQTIDGYLKRIFQRLGICNRLSLMGTRGHHMDETG